MAYRSTVWIIEQTCYNYVGEPVISVDQKKQVTSTLADEKQNYVRFTHDRKYFLQVSSCTYTCGTLSTDADQDISLSSPSIVTGTSLGTPHLRYVFPAASRRSVKKQKIEPPRRNDASQTEKCTQQHNSYEGNRRIFKKLIEGHLFNNEVKFREFFRVNREQFNFILSLVKDDLTKEPTMRVPVPISPDEKLAITLRFLATGESFRSLSFSFRIFYSYISVIVKETLIALKQMLMPLFLPNPNSIDYKVKANEFYTKWNFPNCILAIDGQHVRIRCPNNSGSLYFNYKDYFSIVLMAMVDANYKFIAINVGSFGREGDSGIFVKSNMGQQILNFTFKFPQDCALPNTNLVVPHVIPGDQAFRLHKHILRPFSQKSARGDSGKTIFNYRFSRARRVTENAFENKVESESSTKSLEFNSSSEDSEKELVVKFNIFLNFGVLVAMNVDGPGVDGLGVNGLGVDGVDYINSDNNIDGVIICYVIHYQ
ncbi:hypothetical protein QTP88_019614 [Uroleucon formosanum]